MSVKWCLPQFPECSRNMKRLSDTLTLGVRKVSQQFPLLKETCRGGSLVSERTMLRETSTESQITLPQQLVRILRPGHTRLLGSEVAASRSSHMAVGLCQLDVAA